MVTKNVPVLTLQETRQRRDACNRLFRPNGLVDQAMDDFEVQAEIDDGTTRKDAVWHWLDKHHRDMAPWYTLLCAERPVPVRCPDHSFIRHRDGTVDLLS